MDEKIFHNIFNVAVRRSALPLCGQSLQSLTALASQEHTDRSQNSRVGLGGTLHVVCDNLLGFVMLVLFSCGGYMSC